MKKVINTLKVETKAEKEKAKRAQSDNSSQSPKKIINKFDINEWPWPLILIVAILVALGVRFGVSQLFSSSQIGFVWLEIIKLVISFAVLLAIASVSESSKVGIAVAIFVVVFFVVSLANHDYPRKVEVADTKNSPSEQIDFLRLAPGTHTFELEAGEETPWRGVPKGMTTNVGYSSEDYDYTVIFNDGTSYKGDPNTFIPHKVGKFWKIRAHSKQTVYVTIL